jgi:Zn-dependent M16 (insulinase) family peptidase
MRERYGVILFDSSNLIVRIYETNTRSWKLVYYFEKSLELHLISDVILDFFASPYAQHIAEWKVCSRNTEEFITSTMTKMTGIPIETLTLAREQELLCKGMFTELW